MKTLSPAEALYKLKEGYARHLAGEHRHGSGTGPERIVEVLHGRHPYAVVHTGSPLPIVLGYTGRRAAGAAAAAYRDSGRSESFAMGAITESLLPAVIATRPGNEYDVRERIDAAALWHVKHCVQYSIRRSAVLHRLCRENRFSVIGAFYDLATGQVDSINDGGGRE